MSTYFTLMGIVIGITLVFQGMTIWYKRKEIDALKNIIDNKNREIIALRELLDIKDDECNRMMLTETMRITDDWMERGMQGVELIRELTEVMVKQQEQLDAAKAQS